MAAPFVTVARILLALVPLAKRIAEAMRKDSPGGKRITESELLAIFLGETPRTLRRLERVAEGVEPGEDE